MNIFPRTFPSFMMMTRLASTFFCIYFCLLSFLLPSSCGGSVGLDTADNENHKVIHPPTTQDFPPISTFHIQIFFLSCEERNKNIISFYDFFFFFARCCSVQQSLMICYALCARPSGAVLEVHTSGSKGKQSLGVAASAVAGGNPFLSGRKKKKIRLEKMK